MFKKLIFMISALTITLVGCQAANDNNTQSINENSNDGETNEIIELPDTHLQKFDSGAQVEQLNQFLTSLGYDMNDSSEFNQLTTWALTDIQLQLSPDKVTGMYDEHTKDILGSLKDESLSISVGDQLTKPEKPDTLTNPVENPYDVLALVNKEHALPSDYLPEDLVVPDVRFPFTEDVPKKQLRKVAATALENLFKSSEEAGLELFAQSGYRSYERQEAIFNNNIERHGEEHANTYSARPGESEHQTGLVMDVTNQAVNFELTTEFGETEEGIWLKDNAHKYGFIIRYPKDKEDITKYQYEPWHIRYVGKNLAKELHEKEITLEEFYQ